MKATPTAIVPRDRLPSGREALDEPFAAFPSWHMRITCDQCGKDRMLNEVHTAPRNLPVRELRHDGRGGGLNEWNC
jgi:hypothetical protein